MPFSRGIAHFNRNFTNRLTSKVAGHLPGFGIVHHVGRKSGRAYRTPVNAFATDEGYIIALTYGSESDWVKNVLAAQSCDLETRGQLVQLYSPRIIVDQANSWAPLVVRLILNALNVTQHMQLSEENSIPDRQ